MRGLLSSALVQSTHPALCSHLRELVHTQWWSPERVDELHRDRLGRLLRHAVTQVPRYRELAAARGWQPREVDHGLLTAFPLVDKTVMTEEQATFLAEDARADDRISDSTGGSSGVWFGFYYDRRQKEHRRATDLYSRTLTGWRLGDPIAVVWGHRGDYAAAMTTKARLADKWMHRRIFLNAYDMDDAVLERYARALEHHRPRMILGYASSLAFLAEYLRRRGGHHIRPAGIVSSAETLTDEQRSLIEAEFQCRVLNRYGSREFSNIAQQCEQVGGLHVFSTRIHVEVLRPDGTACVPGERGEIVITDLINGVMPFIRYRTGDLGVVASEPCPCGRGLPTLAAVEGRVSEIIVGPNGKYYSCQSPRLFGADIPGIAQMQVIQEAIAAIEIRIVPDARWSEQSRDLLVERMRGLLGDVQVIVTPVESIPPAPSGKYRFTISKVSPFLTAPERGPHSSAVSGMDMG